MSPQNTNPDAGQGLEWLDDVLAITGQLTAATTGISAFLPIGEFAIRTLFDLFKRDNPQLTPQQFYEYLRSRGRIVKEFSREWLLAHGYTQDASGNWHAPAEQPPPPAPGA